MINAMDYGEMVNKVLEMDREKNDFIVPGKEMYMVDDTSMVYGNMSGKITDVAHRNLQSKLRIPAGFYNRMEEAPGLRSKVVTQLIQNDDRSYMVRELNGNVRAMLSDKFKPIDNAEILSAASPVLKDMDIEFRSANITNERMYLQITFPRLRGEVGVGDVVQYGITITNSEVGMGTVKVSPTIWRLVCSNGMIMKSDVNYRHVGRRTVGEEDYTVYADATILADRKAFRLKLQDTIMASVSEARFDSLLSSMNNAKDDKFEDVTKTIKNVTKRFNFTEMEEQGIMANMFMERENNRWGVLNAITAMAHKTDDPNKAYEYETNGSDILTLSKKDWEIIAA